MTRTALALLTPLVFNASFVRAAPVAPEPAADPLAATAAMVSPAPSVRFTVLTPAVVRMEWDPAGRFEDRASFAVINRRLPVPPFRTAKDGAATVLETGRVKLRYSGAGARFTPENLTATFPAGGKGGLATDWRFGRPAGEANLRGTIRTLDAVSGGTTLPLGLLSRAGWAVIDDSASLVLEGGPRGWVTPRLGIRRVAEATAHPDHTLRPALGPTSSGAPLDADGSPLDLYLFAHGHDYKQALADWRALSGPTPMPPRWAFGGWWSRYWPYRDTDLKALVGEFRAHGVPLDVLVIDMDWHLPGWTGTTWNPKYFPDPDEFLKWCRAEGLKTTLNLHPADGVGRHEAAFPAMARALGREDLLTTTAPDSPEKPGPGRIPFDCADPKFMRAYFDLLHRPLEKQGIDFWWLDWQQGSAINTMPGLDPLPWLNQLHWRDMEDNPARALPDGRRLRPLMFSRWGGLGSHRYPTGFSGDTIINWGSLAFQPGFTATAGNVGYPYWSHDIGGHQPGPVGAELFTRWVQWGALSPVLRTHGTANPGTERRIWTFPDEAFGAMKGAWLLRYALTPYLYAAARQTYDTGLPLVRHMHLEWPEQAEAYRRPNQYLLGDDLLVNPVTAPADPLSSLTIVETWIPPGEWIDRNTRRAVTGPRVVTGVARPSTIPMWVNAGAIIPMAPTRRSEWRDPLTSAAMRTPDPRDIDSGDAIKNTGDRPEGFQILEIWRGPSHTTTLYSDDGATTDYITGKFTTTRVSHRTNRSDGMTTVTIGAVNGAYAGMPSARTFEIRMPDMISAIAVTLEGRPLDEVTSAGPGLRAGWLQTFHQGLIVRAPESSADRELTVVIRWEPDAVGELTRDTAFDFSGMGLKSLAGNENDRASGLLLDQYGITFDFQMAELRRKVSERNQPGLLGTWQRRMGKAKLRAVTPFFFAFESRSLQIDLSKTDSRREWLDTMELVPTLDTASEADGSIVATVTARQFRDVGPLPMFLRISAASATDTRSLACAERVAALGLDRPVGVALRLPATAGGERPRRVLADLEFDLGSGTTFTVKLAKTIDGGGYPWHVAGPFDNPDGIGLDRPLGPDAKPFARPADFDPAATYPGGKSGARVGWRRVKPALAAGDDTAAAGAAIDLHQAFGTPHEAAACFAVTFLDATRDTSATLALGSDDGVAAWIDGREVWRHAVGRPIQPGQDLAPIHLTRGRHVLMLKISQGGFGWAFSAMVTGPDGQPHPDVTAVEGAKP